MPVQTASSKQHSSIYVQRCQRSPLSPQASESVKSHLWSHEVCKRLIIYRFGLYSATGLAISTCKSCTADSEASQSPNSPSAASYAIARPGPSASWIAMFAPTLGKGLNWGVTSPMRVINRACTQHASQHSMVFPFHVC